ncbi:hypothetical protein SISNIDRAFT_462447 [Sistotremastrum niveocremeum HHB9708]|uniref:Uncharacterized protein n=1 Tax=Sistotremastrum niveocremeum HHB9708 TaxID=1314777 RepID=A0A165A5X1_9AGAM|nr:hypothetical protein SISNIDRAFT_462447 [Sistotremastrum niveocremeum HHB9708]
MFATPARPSLMILCQKLVEPVTHWCTVLRANVSAEKDSRPESPTKRPIRRHTFERSPQNQIDTPMDVNWDGASAGIRVIPIPQANEEAAERRRSYKAASLNQETKSKLQKRKRSGFSSSSQSRRHTDSSALSRRASSVPNLILADEVFLSTDPKPAGSRIIHFISSSLARRPSRSARSLSRDKDGGIFWNMEKLPFIRARSPARTCSQHSDTCKFVRSDSSQTRERSFFDNVSGALMQSSESSQHSRSSKYTYMSASSNPRPSSTTSLSCGHLDTFPTLDSSPTTETSLHAWQKLKRHIKLPKFAHSIRA